MNAKIKKHRETVPWTGGGQDSLLTRGWPRGPGAVVGWALAFFGAPSYAATLEHDALNSAGVQAAHIFSLWQLTLWICMLVFGAVLGALVLALRKSSRRREGLRTRSAAGVGGSHEPKESDAGARLWVTGATILSAVLLAGLLFADFITDHAISRLPSEEPVRIELTGYQWWWEGTYSVRGSTDTFGVSGDLYIPVGRPVVVTLKSPDVIHSFWVPNLHGKKDMLPGRVTSISLRADRAGSFLGQCAEFCGVQHALMAFGITAVPAAQYEAWLRRQAAPAAPATADRQKGKALFLANDCSGCHTVRGTSAAGTLGPDLTHVASRPTLAAGSLANTPDNLYRWIYDPQSHKTQSTMPSSTLDAGELRLIAHWLETLE